MKIRFRLFPKQARSLLMSSAIVGGLLGSVLPQAAWAGDPFRTTNPQNISEQTETAFNAVFKDGNYPAAVTALTIAQKQDTAEPLIFALDASLKFLQEDWAGVKVAGQQTLTKAQALATTNPVRGYTYEAIGQVLEGAYALSPAGEGSIRGVPTALSRLNDAYGALKKAQTIAPQDPELNLIQGFMNLMVSLYLPWTKPDQAIQQLQNYAAPAYLSNWALAIAYRDLNRYTDAFSALDKSLSDSDNPQLYYLRAQVRVRQGLQNSANTADLVRAQSDFRRSLARSNQLPKALVAQIFREYCRNQNRIDHHDRDCGALVKPIVDNSGQWGPETVPTLE